MTFPADYIHLCCLVQTVQGDISIYLSPTSDAYPSVVNSNKSHIKKCQCHEVRIRGYKASQPAEQSPTSKNMNLNNSVISST